jgi:hypothetical protein
MQMLDIHASATMGDERTPPQTLDNHTPPLAPSDAASRATDDLPLPLPLKDPRVRVGALRELMYVWTRARAIGYSLCARHIRRARFFGVTRIRVAACTRVSTCA